jgi:hypothetical protein
MSPLAERFTDAAVFDRKGLANTLNAYTYRLAESG